MDAQQSALLIRQIKGAPLTVLVMMLALGRSTGRDELALLTTYSKGTVQDALNQLEYLGLAQNHARYHGWVLTANTRQTLLPAAAPALEVESSDLDGADPDQEGDREVRNPPLDQRSPDRKTSPEVQSSHLARSSSSGSALAGKQSTVRTPETTTTGRGGKHASRQATPNPDAEQAVAELCETGVPERSHGRRGARDSIEMALAGGWTGAVTLEAVQGWIAYAGTPAGKSIDHAGFHAAWRIRRLERAPEVRARVKPAGEVGKKEREEETRRYLEAAYEETLKQGMARWVKMGG